MNIPAYCFPFAIRRLLFLSLLAFFASSFAIAQGASEHRVPVLVELFTSEGCSDCPPADALMAQLDQTQFVAGAQAIVLSEHVTYWNHLGWRDPFSLDAMTARQEQYAQQFGLDSNYTPQMVVDGSQQFVGSDARALNAAVSKAASHAKQNLTIEAARWENGSAVFSVHGDPVAGSRLMAVLAANATHSEVSRGENKGRTLHHIAVVRAIKEFPPDAANGRQLTVSDSASTGKNEADGPLRLVVFLVDRKTGHVIGAAQQLLNR
jgi:hypothetical protein